MAKKRPPGITAVCVLGFLSAGSFLLGAYLQLHLQLQNAQPLSHVHLALGSVIVSICMVGLWLMKKWSLIAFTVFVLILQVVYLAAGTWSIWSLVVPGIILYVGFLNYSEMD